jgi:hypothetical protein
MICRQLTRLERFQMTEFRQNTILWSDKSTKLVSVMNEPTLNPLDDRRLISDEGFVDRREQNVVPKSNRRTSAKERRQQEEDRRAAYRCSLNADEMGTIIVKEQLNLLDENGEVKEVQVVDSSYEVQIIDQSSGGFGFKVCAEVPLEQGHVIRLANPAGMHLIEVCSIRLEEGLGVQQVGCKLTDNLVNEAPPVSVLELFVDRRLSADTSKTTAFLIGSLVMIWLAVIVYTMIGKI